MTQFKLNFGIDFHSLYERTGLQLVDHIFLQELAATNNDLYIRLVSYRQSDTKIGDKEYSHFIIELAPYVEDFIAKLFAIEPFVRKLTETHNSFAVIYHCKRSFIQRQALKSYGEDVASAISGEEITLRLEELFGAKMAEGVYAASVMSWLDSNDSERLDLAARYACWAVYTDAGQARHKHGVLFKIPRKLNAQNLIPVEAVLSHGCKEWRLPEQYLRNRQGFKLADHGIVPEYAMDQAHYCIYCHNQGKDSCSKGFKDKDGAFKKNEHDVTLAGCPLEEKISEMNSLKAAGNIVAALAVITLDNPMVAATGHRICNDCMKACIYQKQEPVNIPQIETKILQDVISLPFGFEIYSLFTRWNPLNLKQPLPKLDSGYRVLVVGLGPAGFTLAHHLLNDGHVVIGIDGLKIEPLPVELSGVDMEGKRSEFAPVKNINDIWEELDTRVAGGFGGVAEYGITVRWEKNYLKLIRLLLERRQNFAMYGGVRFGSAINYNSAFELGFDHIALALGAGKPNLINMANCLSKGVRTASDFLMALQLTGAARSDSIANLQVRLPVVVIGGGLTAIDTATEALAYYPVQVEKFLERYETLVITYGEEYVRTAWTPEEKEIADEFIEHARALRAERQKSQPDILALLKHWGGSKIIYRGQLIKSPSYRFNHEEVEQALQEGITFIENISPAGVILDKYQHVCHLLTKDIDSNEVVIPAKTVLIAAGTNPNTVLAREDPAHFMLDGKYFRAVDENGILVQPEKVAKPGTPYVLTAVGERARSVSFFGDTHPSFSGNVVKAMASAKQGYHVISNILHKHKPSRSNESFIKGLHGEITAKIAKIERLTPNIIEIIVKAPLAANEFKPGQFYRLQNYECHARRENGTVFAMEGIALTGASVDKDKGLVSLIALELGGSTNLCQYLREGEPVVLMGPTGSPTEIIANKNIVLVGGGLGNAVLFSIGKAFREAGSKVLYFAGYRQAIDRYKVSEIEQAADYIVWCCEEAELDIARQQDKSFKGNVVEAMVAYAKGALGVTDLPLSAIDHLIAIGSDKMMQAVNKARITTLLPYLKPGHTAIASINSPMQCMMKEICAQCLQKHSDPVTGEEKYVYSCFNQDQNMAEVDFKHLESRLAQNSLQEKLTSLWLHYCIR